MEQDLSRKERERLRHKEEIMAGAIKLFAEKGFHNVSMQEIATATEFATGTLYNFFQNKEALYAELLISCGRKIMATLYPTLEGSKSEEEKIREFIAVHKVILAENSQMIALFLSELNRISMVIPPFAEEEIERIRIDVLNQLAGIVEAGIEHGRFRRCNAFMASAALSAMLEFLIFSVIKYPHFVALEEGLAEIETLFFQGITPSGDRTHAG